MPRFPGLDQFTAGEAGAAANPDNLCAWASYGRTRLRALFWMPIAPPLRPASDLLPPPEQAQALFTAYLLEKALYELLYELNNRPTWLRIPIGGILSM